MPSDDDLVRRGDVRRSFSDYYPAAGDDFNATLDRVPASAEAAAAVALARAVDRHDRHMAEQGRPLAEMSPVGIALAAYRVARAKGGAA